MIPSNCRPGFTLIEILAAMGAFILVFLTGSAGLMRLMQAQTLNQQRTLAASAALLIADWHAAMSPLSQDTFVNDIYGVNGLLEPLCVPAAMPDVVWKGAQIDPDDLIGYFHASVPTPPYAMDLAAYQNIIVTSPTTGSVVDDSGMKLVRVSFWYGDHASCYPVSIPDTYFFLGTYLMPDQAP